MWCIAEEVGRPPPAEDDPGGDEDADSDDDSFKENRRPAQRYPMSIDIAADKTFGVQCLADMIHLPPAMSCCCHLLTDVLTMLLKCTPVSWIPAYSASGQSHGSRASSLVHLRTSGHGTSRQVALARCCSAKPMARTMQSSQLLDA